MTLPSPEPSYTVSQLGEEIRLFLDEAFPSVWVVGEVQRMRPSRRGHLYFELVEKGDRDEIVGKLDAVAWRSDHERIRWALAQAGQRLADGVEIRCRGQVDFYPAGGRLQLVVREVDPLFTEGLLEQRRRATLEALAAADLLELNRRLVLSPVPLSIGLITSAESAAYHDFVSTLAESGYGFRVLFAHAAVQGRQAEPEVVSALRLMAAAGVDCLALVRGGGSRADLSCFDSRAVAEAVARCPVPVLTGLGHEIDRSICDRVAHTALKTPTKVGEFLVERVQSADAQLARLGAAVCREAAESLRRAGREVERIRSGLRLAGRQAEAWAERVGSVGSVLARVAYGRLRVESQRHETQARRLRAAAPRILRRQQRLPEGAARRLTSFTRFRLQAARDRLESLDRLCCELAPQRLLRRGFSITRTARGELVKRPQQVAIGEVVHTRLAGGRLTSRVETTAPQPGRAGG